MRQTHFVTRECIFDTLYYEDIATKMDLDTLLTFILPAAVRAIDVDIRDGTRYPPLDKSVVIEGGTVEIACLFRYIYELKEVQLYGKRADIHGHLLTNSKV